MASIFLKVSSWWKGCYFGGILVIASLLLTMVKWLHCMLYYIDLQVREKDFGHENSNSMHLFVSKF